MYYSNLSDDQMINAKRVFEERTEFYEVLLKWLKSGLLESRFYLVSRMPLFEGHAKVAANDIEVASVNGRLVSIMKDPILSGYAFARLVDDCVNTGIRRLSKDELFMSGLVRFAITFRNRERKGEGMSLCTVNDGNKTELAYSMHTKVVNDVSGLLK